MGIEEGTFWDEHWVLYGNQFDNKFHIKKKKEKEDWWSCCCFLREIIHFTLMGNIKQKENEFRWEREEETE